MEIVSNLNQLLLYMPRSDKSRSCKVCLHRCSIIAVFKCRDKRGEEDLTAAPLLVKYVIKTSALEFLNVPLSCYKRLEIFKMKCFRDIILVWGVLYQGVLTLTLN